MGQDPVVLEANRFKSFLEPCGKQSRRLTGRRNTSRKDNGGVERYKDKKKLGQEGYQHTVDNLSMSFQR